MQLSMKNHILAARCEDKGEKTLWNKKEKIKQKSFFFFLFFSIKESSMIKAVDFDLKLFLGLILSFTES